MRGDAARWSAGTVHNTAAAGGVELEDTAHSTGCYVRRRRQHHGHHLLHQPPIGSRQKHILDPLGAGLVIAGLGCCHYRLHDGAPLGRKTSGGSTMTMAATKPGCAAANCRTITPFML